MNTKNLMVSFCTIAIVLFLVAFVSAAEIATIDSVEVNGVDTNGYNVAVIAGNTLNIEVLFTALSDNSNVRIEAELTGTKVDVSEKTAFFDVEADKTYPKSLELTLPYELKDVQSGDFNLNVRIWNSETESEYSTILRIQRPSFNADVMSIEVSQTVVAGEMLPVDVVLKNIGYNDLDDTYVTVSIPALGIEKTSYFGDIVSLEDNDNDDFAKGRFYLRVPYEALEGIYTIEVEVSNDDLNVIESEEIIVKNDFSAGNLIVNSFRKIVATGQDAEYSFMIVNPTNQLKVYQIVTESNSNLYTNANTAVIAVPAGTSKTVTVTANAVEEGEHTFNVNVLSGNNLEGVITFSLNAEGKQSNSIAVLTVILAIVFLVLLVVLIVLLGKKPQKTEEFGESYY